MKHKKNIGIETERERDGYTQSKVSIRSNLILVFLQNFYVFMHPLTILKKNIGIGTER
jgi:hypothetical protein